MNSPLSLTLSLCFPRPCRKCGKFDISAINFFFCKECLNKLSSIKFFCIICGFDFLGECHEKKCGRCLEKASFVYRRARSVYIYDGTVKDLVKIFKFRKKRKLGKILGSLMAKDFFNKFPNSDYDFIVPVPIHRKRLNERQFNQSEVLAAELGKHIHIPLLFDTLVQKRSSVEQVNLGVKERWKNVKGIYSVSKDIENKGILLIDDVFTTGATTYECSKLLIEHGASYVDIFTFARTRL